MSTERFDTPQTDAPSQVERATLPGEWARAPYLFLHNAMGWEAICVGDDPKNPKDYELVPLLQRIEGRDGVGGVTYNRTSGKLNFAGAIQGHAAMSNPSYPIDANDRRLGKWTGYNTRFFPVTGGQRRYIEPGERLSRLSNGVVLAAQDKAERLEFLRVLKERGLVEPMQVEVYDAMLAKLEQRLRNQVRLKKDTVDTTFAIAALKAAWAKEHQSARAESIEVEVGEASVENTAAVPTGGGRTKRQPAVT